MRTRKVIDTSVLPSVILFIVFVIINSILSKNFMRASAWISFLQTVIPILIISIGQAVVIIGGGIDISVGSTICVVNVIMATTSSFEGSALKPVIIGLSAAIAIGAFNGFLVAKLRTPALLATFATSFIGNGIALTILPIPGGQVPLSLSNFYHFKFFNTIPLALIYVVFVLLIWLIWKKSPMGVALYAVGHNKYKAFFSGIEVYKIQFYTFVFSGFAAGIAGLCISSNISAGDPRIGSVMTLNSVAACVIGGISLAGGSGTVIGSIFGAMFIYLILITVMGMNVPVYYQDLVSGIIIVIGIIIAVYIQKRGRPTKTY